MAAWSAIAPGSSLILPRILEGPRWAPVAQVAQPPAPFGHTGRATRDPEQPTPVTAEVRVRATKNCATDGSGNGHGCRRAIQEHARAKPAKRRIVLGSAVVLGSPDPKASGAHRGPLGP